MCGDIEELDAEKVEEQKDIAEALQQDFMDLLTEKVNGGLEEEHSLSDDEQACTDGKGRPVTGGYQAALIDPPAYKEMALQFGHVERMAASEEGSDDRH